MDLRNQARWIQAEGGDEKFHYVADALEQLPDSTILDGEIVALNAGSLVRGSCTCRVRCRGAVHGVRADQRSEIRKMPVRRSAPKRRATLGPGTDGREDEGLRLAETWAVVRIDFLQWTGADHLRHTMFGEMRDDKDPRKVVRPPAEVRGPSAPAAHDNLFAPAANRTAPPFVALLPERRPC